MRKSALLLAATALATLPVMAQPPSGDGALQKFPTPPPAVTAENSIIGPDYANAPESVANPAVPEGEVREFILYSQDSKIYTGIVRVQNMPRPVLMSAMSMSISPANWRPARRRPSWWCRTVIPMSGA